tara:strand:- start:342 stop:626 length:285 start_codon:yes stop_codon:yes gene_type:complete
MGPTFILNLLQDIVDGTFYAVKKDAPSRDSYVLGHKVIDQEILGDQKGIPHLAHDVDAHTLEVVDVHHSVFQMLFGQLLDFCFYEVGLGAGRIL